MRDAGQFSKDNAEFGAFSTFLQKGWMLVESWLTRSLCALSQHWRDTAAALNRPLACGDGCNIPLCSHFFLLILLPFSLFPSSSAFYGIYLFSFHLALMKFIP